MIRYRRIAPVWTFVTWMLVLLMVEPQTRIVGQESSTYIRALEVILAPSPTKLAASSILLLTATSDPGRPTLAPITNQTINVGQRLSVTVKATDRDLPTQTLQFSLLEKPAGATVRTIRGTNAVIGWTPTRDSADTTNRFTVVVSDNGTPSLSATQSFQVIVTDFAQSALGTTVIQAGQDGCLPLTIDSSETITNIEMTIRWPLGTFTNFTVTPTAPQICSATLQSVSPTQAVVRLFTCPGQSLTLTQAVDLADLCFTALPGQPSAFVPLIITNSTVRTLAGNQITNRTALAGTVVVVGSDPLLEIARTADQGRQLFLYANPGRFYQIDSTTNLSDSAAWQLACRVPMTGPALVLCCVDLTGPTKFFRARELGAGPTNEPPRVDAGPDQIISTNITTLHGSATDDGLPAGCKPLTYAWSRLSGPGPATFSNPTSAVTTVSFSARGTYVFRLSASDTQSTNSDDVTISAPSFNCSLAEEEGWLARVSSPLPPASAGSVLFNNCTIVLNEGGSFEVAAETTFAIPATPSMLVLTYETPTFDSTSSGLMRDAFEVALVDTAGRPLTFTIQGEAGLTPASVLSPAVLPPSPDALFNHTDGKPPFIARGSAVTPTIGGARQLSMDVSHLAPGTAAKLILRLVNNDRDRVSSVRIADVSSQSTPLSQTSSGSPGTALSLVGPATAALGNSNSSNPCPPPHLRFQTSGTPTQGTSLTCLSPPSDLVAWWPGDGNAFDIASARPSTKLGGFGYETGKISDAFNFDGVNDYIDLGEPADLQITTSDYTIAGWIMIAATPNNSSSQCAARYPVFGFGWGYNVSILSNRQIRFYQYYDNRSSASLISHQSISTNTFHHVAAVRSQSEMRLYIDGALDSSRAFTNESVYFQPGDTLKIGAMDCGSSRFFFKGRIDELTVFKRALSSNEITAIYEAGANGICKFPSQFPGQTNSPTLVFYPNDARSWQGATVGTFAELFYGANTPATRQLVVDRQLLDAGLFSLSNTFPAVLLPTQWTSGNIERGRSLDSIGSGGYEFEHVESLFTVYATANAIDNLWFGSGTNVGETVFDLGAPSAKAAVFPTIDHGPLPQEAIESTVYLSIDRVNWTPAVVQRVWLEGWHPNLGIKWDGFVYAVGTSNNALFRYASTTWGGPGALQPLYGTDDEINGIVGLTEDYFPVQRIVPSSPTLTVTAPTDNAHIGPGAALLTGYTIADRPDIFGILTTNSVLLVTVNGTPVDALDAAGNFFSSIDVRPGQNVFEVVATDVFSQSTTNTVTVYGTTCPQNFASLGEVSASVVPDYGRTSFNEWTKVLYADLALRNAGTYPIRAPFYVGVTRISDPTVKLLAPDGVSADGIPYYDYSDALANGALDIGHSSLPRALAFHNPNKVQFTYDLVVLGQLNQAPAFTTTPTLEAIAGKPYAYAFNATDPDGDALTYSLITGPAGLTLNPQLQTLNWSPLATNLGTHDIRLRADDGKGGIAEQHYLLNVINQPSNRPPYFVSTPVTMARISTNSLPPSASKFTNGQIFIASSTYAREVRVYNYESLLFIRSFSHPLFAGGYNPRGIAFNERGNLLCASDTHFVEFSDYGVEYSRYPKHTVEATENLIFDKVGNLYTTTATGGTDKLNQYRASDYVFLQTISLPAGSGSLTGITFDGHGRLYVGSQSDRKIHILQASSDFTSFAYLRSFDAPNSVEGIQFNQNGELIAAGGAGGDLVRYNAETGAILGTFDAPFDFWPVPLTVDNQGRIFTSDFENGAGTTQADLIRFSPNGATFVATNDPNLFGPFGLAISGTVLPGAPSLQTYVYDADARDPDGDTLTYSLVVAPTNMTINPVTGLIGWGPTADQIGIHNVTAQAADGRGGITTQSYRICVLPAEGNRAPMIVSCPLANAVSGQTYVTDVNALDPDNDPITFSLRSGPSGMTINPTTGVLTWETPSSPITNRITFTETGLVAGYGPDPYFPGTPKGTAISNQFSSLGVVFSVSSNGAAYLSNFSVIGGAVSPSGSNTLTINTIPEQNGAATLIARFVDPVTGGPATVQASTFSVFVADANPTSTPRIFVRTFDTTGSLIEERGLTSEGEVLRFSSGNIARVEFIDTGGDGHVIDDFTFGQVIPISADVVVRASDGRGGFDDQSFTVNAGQSGTGEIHGTVFNDLNADGDRRSADLLVNSEGTDCILHYDGATGEFRGIFASSADGRTDKPNALVLGPDDFLYADSFRGAYQVVRYHRESGAFIDVFVPAGSGGLTRGTGLAFGPDGNLYVGSYENNSVLRYNGTTGAFIDAFVPSGSGGLSGTGSIRFGPDGKLYVGSSLNSRILRYDGSTGAFLNTFVSEGSGGISSPQQLEFGKDGNLYIPGFNNNAVFRFNGTNGSFMDIFASGGNLNGPAGCRFGPDGHLYVSSYYNSQILRFDENSGALIDAFISQGNGGLVHPTGFEFTSHTIDPGLAGWTVYLDENRNGRRDLCEQFTLTDANGSYSFKNLVSDCYSVGVERLPGWAFAPVTSEISRQILANGSFELVRETSLDPGWPSFTGFSNGDTRLFGWVVTATNGTPGLRGLSYVNRFPPHDGSYQFLFDGGNTIPGDSISQTFCTIEGEPYQVSFHVGRDGQGAGEMSLLATAISSEGVTLASHTAIAPSVPGYGSIHSFSFTAQSAATTLRFFDTSSATLSVDIYLDDVSVIGPPTRGARLVTAFDGLSVGNKDFAVVQHNGTLPNRNPVFISSAPAYPVQANAVNLYPSTALDDDGDLLRYDLVAHPEGMLVETNSGVVAWRPLPTQLGTHEVILRVQDGRGGVALQSWQITVTAPNSPPFITTFPPGPAVVGLPYRYAIRAQDPESQPITFALTTNAPAGLTLTSGSSNSALLSWTPALAQLGTNPVEIIVRDSEGAEARQSFGLEVVVSAPNRPPAITSTPRTQTRVGAAYAYVVEVSDPDGDPVTVTLLSGPSGMVATNLPVTDGVESVPTIYWPGAELGSYTVLLRASDGRSGTADQQFTLNVASSLNNQPPLITSLPLEHATAGQTYDYQLTASDPDGDAVTWRVLTGPVGMSLDSATGRLLWIPTLEQMGTNAVVIEATDTLLATATQTFSIDVGCLNRPPQITSVPPTAAQTGDPYLYAPRGNDPDGDRLVWSLVPGQFPPGMTIDGTNGLVRWTPTTNQVGGTIVSVRLTDGRGGNDTQTFTLYAANLTANRPPYFVSKPVTVSYPSGAAIADVPVSFSDREMGSQDWSVTSYLTGVGGEYVRTTSSSGGFPGPFVRFDTRVFSGNEIRYQLVASFLTNAVYDPSTQGAIESIDGRLSSIMLVAAGGFPPGHAFGFLVFQGNMLFTGGNDLVQSNWRTLTTNLTAESFTRYPIPTDGSPLHPDFSENGSPIQFGFYLISGNAVVNSGDQVLASGFDNFEITVRRPLYAYSYDSDALDSDGDSLSYLLATAPTGMTINATNGLIRWAPTTNQIGTHPVMVVATDDQGGSGIQNYFVQVLAPRTNRPPQITSSPRTNAIPSIAYRYDIGAFDPDGDALTYALVAPVPSGLVIDNLGRIAWTPSFAQFGVFPITVTASDSFGASTTQAFNLFVTADTEPPVVSLAVGYNLNDAAGNRFVQIGTEVPVRVQVSDNVGVASRELRVAGQVIPLSASGGASVLFPTSGPIPAIAQATDFSGNVTFTTNMVQVVDPNAASTVAIVIHSPTNTTEVTRSVPVIATITSQVPLFDYQVEFAPIDSDMATMELSMDDPSLVFQTITNVTLPPNTFGLTNVTVGRFDPLMLLNGAYVIRVSAFDQNRQGQREGVIVNVAGNLKFGEFRLEFTDLTIPVAGIPITVKRVYDTRESRRQGDFGFGWSLGVQDAHILEIGKRPFYGLGDEETTFTTRTRVYMTTPDGRRVGFNFTPEFAGGSFAFGAFFRPAFTADPGVYDRLEAVPADAGYQIESDGSVSTGFGLVGLDPATYRLTTRDNLVYDYDQRAGLKSVIDPNGNRLLYTRDGIFHYSAGATDADQSIRFVRDAQGRIAQIIDPTGKILRYTYDAAGDLRAFADQVTNVTQYAYSQARAHFLTNIIDPFGRSALRMDYDASGRLTGVRDATGNPLTQDFNSDSNTGTYQDGNGNVTVVKYDEQGNETVRMLPGISTNYFAFDANNNLLASTNGRGFSTNFTYDARGNVTSITDSLSNRTTIAYSAQKKPIGVTNALGQVISLAYNSSGQLTQVVNNAGFKTSVTRDAMGRVASLTDATGTNTTIFDYNGGCACGKPGKVINPDGSFKITEYNSLGQVTREVNELGAEKLSFFDDTGKLLWTRDPLTNYTQFFYRGPLLTNVVDALGRSTRYEYDSLNRTNKIIDAENGVVEFRYDNNGNRTHVIDAVTNVTTFVYDSANRLKMQIDPLGHTNFFGYDAAGNRTEAIDRNGRKRTFAYDAANRMTNELWWEGTNVVRSIVFGFNELGVQTLAADPAARYTYNYDSLNRLERVLSQSAGVPDFTLLYTYTKLGQVESVTDNYGVRVGSGYDNRNRLSQRTWQGPGVDTARLDFAFDVAGNRTRTDRYADLAGANRVGFTTNAYNHAGIVTNITHLGPASQILAKYDYNFDAAYQIRNWTINNQPSAYEYDRTGQLTNAQNTAQPNENFRFDANGNRVGAQSGGSYLVGRNNQILSDGTNSYAYDFEGNMTSRSNTVTGVLTTYQWDHRNRLMSVLDRNPVGVVTQTVAFVYDAMNRRLSKTVNAPQTTNVVRFLYNQDDSWADLDGTNAVIARYLHGARIDELLARQRTSDGRGWYLTDHLGTVRDIANAAGAVVAHVDYSSFGQVLGVSNPIAVDRFLFTGRELDGETGHYFSRARYYSASVGRFISQDPVGFTAADFNLYRYAQNEPFVHFDPFGTFSTLSYGVTLRLVVVFTARIHAAVIAKVVLSTVLFAIFGELTCGGTTPMKFIQDLGLDTLVELSGKNLLGLITDILDLIAPCDAQ